MRLVRYRSQSGPRAAIVAGLLAHPLPASMDALTLLAARPPEDAMLSLCEDPLPLADLSLLPPVEPGAVRDLITFEQHLDGVRRGFGEEGAISAAWYESPAFYFSNPYSLIGANDDVPMPPGSTVLDFELEVAAVIGRDGFNLDSAQARDHILGYTILNDWSARDLQRAEMTVGLGPAKGKDTATTLGPCLVTADELEPYRHGDRYELRASASVNGTDIGGDTLANMAWSFESMVAYASRGTWVRTGDVLGSGTTGAGCLAELWGRDGSRTPPPLRPGDVVAMSVDHLGTISNRIVPGAESKPIPRARRVPRERWSIR